MWGDIMITATGPVAASGSRRISAHSERSCAGSWDCIHVTFTPVSGSNSVREASHVADGSVDRGWPGVPG